MYKYATNISVLQIDETQRVMHFYYFKLQSVFSKIDMSKCIRP